MAKNNKNPEVPAPTAAVEQAKAVEAEVFGDGASQPMPVRSETSSDEHTGMQEVPAEIVSEGPRYIEEPVSEEVRVFGSEAEAMAREVQPESTVTVPMSVLERMQRQILDLQQGQSDASSVYDPLSPELKKKLINVTYYTDDAGKQWLVLGMRERVFPNGARTMVYADGVDQDKRPIYKALLEIADVETGEKRDVEVIYENFIKLSIPVQTEALVTNEKIIDMTPSEEVVEVTSYQDTRNGGIRGQGSGVFVRASVQGKLLTFEVEQAGKRFQVTSDVINIK